MRSRAAALMVSLMALPSTGLPSAAGAAPWTQLELTSPTNLGVFHIKATTTIEDEGIRLDQLSIDLDGKPLSWPKKVDLRVIKPQLNKMEVVSTRSITCLDGCPDISNWPVWLHFPFGENPANSGDNACDQPMVSFEFSREGVESITMFTCVKGANQERELYSRK